MMAVDAIRKCLNILQRRYIIEDAQETAHCSYAAEVVLDCIRQIEDTFTQEHP